MVKRAKKETPGSTRAKLTADFVELLESDWREHGQGVIESLRVSRPEIYARLVADLVPKQIETSAVGSEFETMTAAELDAYIIEHSASDIARAERWLEAAKKLAANLAKEATAKTFQERNPNAPKPRPLAHNGKAQQDADPVLVILPDEATP